MQFGRDLLVREAFGERLQDFPFAGCDLLDARACLYLFLAVLSGKAEQRDQLFLGEEGIAFAEASPWPDASTAGDDVTALDLRMRANP